MQLLPLVVGQTVRLLDDPVLIRQVTSLERRARSGGIDLVDHRPTAHARDDVSNAAAGACVLAWQHGAGTSEVSISKQRPRLVLGEWQRPLDRQTMPR